MGKIIEYTITRNLYWWEMVEEVNKMIANGWEPQGGAFFQGSYHQAMIKREDKDE